MITFMKQETLQNFVSGNFFIFLFLSCRQSLKTGERNFVDYCQKSNLKNKIQKNLIWNPQVHTWNSSLSQMVWWTGLFEAIQSCHTVISNWKLTITHLLCASVLKLCPKRCETWGPAGGSKLESGGISATATSPPSSTIFGSLESWLVVVGDWGAADLGCIFFMCILGSMWALLCAWVKLGSLWSHFLPCRGT